MHHRFWVELHDARHEQRALLRRTDEQRARELGRVGDDHGRGLLRGSGGIDDALEACAEALVGRQRDGHAEGRLLEEHRRRGRKQQVHVVPGAVVEDLPHLFQDPLRAHHGVEVEVLQRRGREHHVVDRRGAQVLGRARALLVLRARDPCAGHPLRALLAVDGAEDAHAAHAALAVRGQVARLTRVNVGHGRASA